MFRGGRALGALAFMAMVLAACSGSTSFSIGGTSVDKAGEELITGDLAEQLGLGPLTATCPEIPDAEVGSEFSCSATTEDGRTVLFDGVVDREDHINLQSSNFATPEQLEQGLFQVLNNQNPAAGLTREGVDCGDQPMVIEASVEGSNQLNCAVQPANGSLQTATMTVNNSDFNDIDVAFASDGAQGEAPTEDAADSEDAAGSDEAADSAGSDVAAGSATPDEVAQATLVTLEDLGANWTAAPQGDDSVDYNTIDGCGPIADLVDNDGHLAEAKSAEFSSEQTSVIHNVRVYADEAAATAVVAGWAEQLALDCAVEGIEQSAAESFAAGELDPYEEIDINLQAFQDMEGEPRYTNLEISNTLLGPDLEFVVINDVFFLQVGPVLSQVAVTNPTEVWSNTTPLLELVVERMGETEATLQGS